MATKSERELEIEQGLREPGGALIGGLNVLDYVQGIEDRKASRPPPQGVTSTSYDLGRSRAAREAEEAADLHRELDLQRSETRARVRALLASHPDLLADFDATIAALESLKTSTRSA